MRGNPLIPPVVGGAPGLGVEVEGAEVQCGDLQIGLEVDALAVAEGVAVVGAGGEPEALVAERDHVLGVERLDVRRRVARPLGDDRRRAAVAARLVGELPREHGRRRRVPRDHGLDVRPVLRLGRRVRVPGFGRAAEGGDVLFKISMLAREIRDSITCNPLQLSRAGFREASCAGKYRISQGKMEGGEKKKKMRKKKCHSQQAYHRSHPSCSQS